MSNENREAIAKEAGWVPESEWDPDKPAPKAGFKTADEFMDDGAVMLKSTNKQLQKLQAKLDKSEKTNEQMQTDFRQMSALVQRDHQVKLEAMKRELEGKRQVAIDEGDSEAAIAADREINQLSAAKPSTSQVDPAMEATVERWLSVNTWYTQNPDLRDKADAIGRRIDAEGQIPPGASRLAAVEAEVRRLYPDDLSSEIVVGGVPGNPEGGRATTSKSSGRTYDDLPSDAREAYDRMKKLNPALTKPQYLSQYEWD